MLFRYANKLGEILMMARIRHVTDGIFSFPAELHHCYPSRVFPQAGDGPSIHRIGQFHPILRRHPRHCYRWNRLWQQARHVHRHRGTWSFSRGHYRFEAIGGDDQDVGSNCSSWRHRCIFESSWCVGFVTYHPHEGINIRTNHDGHAFRIRVYHRYSIWYFGLLRRLSDTELQHQEDGCPANSSRSVERLFFSVSINRRRMYSYELYFDDAN